MALDVPEVVHVLSTGGHAVFVRGAGPLSGTTVIPRNRRIVGPHDILNIAKFVVGHERVPLIAIVRHPPGVDRRAVVNRATEVSGVAHERLAIGDKRTGSTVGHAGLRLRCHALSLHHPADKSNS